MTSPWHQLIPFGNCGPEGVAVEAQASVVREEQLLQLRYRVRGSGGLVLPGRTAVAERRDGLWENTCLEAFLAPGAAPGRPDAAETEGYWEFNLAPSGDWNVYRLEGYRQGLAPESFYDNQPLAITLGEGQSDAGADTLELSLCCPMPPALAAAAQLKVGLTAVIETRSGEISYWALHHPGAEADFHQHGGWTLRL
jgi:hypothetical protein